MIIFTFSTFGRFAILVCLFRIRFETNNWIESVRVCASLFCEPNNKEGLSFAPYAQTPKKTSQLVLNCHLSVWKPFFVRSEGGIMKFSGK